MATWDKQRLQHNRYHNDSLDDLTEQVSRHTECANPNYASRLSTS